MKNTIFSLIIMLGAVLKPDAADAGPQQIQYPCSLVLLGHVQTHTPVNAKGAALAYWIQRMGTDYRISLSLHAQYLPDPASLGNYDRYEGFAQVPGEISWRFTLYPTPGQSAVSEEEVPTWAGRFDLISAPLEKAVVQVRLSNSKTGVLGPVILENQMTACKAP